MVLSAIAVIPITSDTMDTLQITGFTSLGCVAFIGMIYGEILLLQRVECENYVYHDDDMDKDTRPPSCYQLKYRW